MKLWALARAKGKVSQQLRELWKMRSLSLLQFKCYPPLVFCLVGDYSACSKLKGKKYKQNSLLKTYKNEIKILADPGLAEGLDGVN